MTLVEASEKYGIPVSTLARACRLGVLRHTIKERAGRGGRRYDVRELDVRHFRKHVWRPKAA